MTSSERKQLIHTIFHDVIALPEKQREAVLDQRCPDEEVRAEVEALLAADDSAETDFLEPTFTAAGGVPVHTVARIRCPNCRTPIEVLGDDPAEVECPSCASSIPVQSTPPELTDTHRYQPQPLGQYTLVEDVGTGSFGTVWKALDTKLQRIVAIKRPRLDRCTPEDLALFQREARAAAQLEHPSIVRLHGVESDGTAPFLVSEFIDGVSLADYIRDNPPGPNQIVDWMITLAGALHHAHERGVIHRDFKPSNVLIDTEGGLHITDFGLAKRETGEVTMTVQGQILGTLQYMPPEQARGEAHLVDRRADVYALGATLYRLLTGKTPFAGISTLLLHKIQTVDPVAPRSIDKSIDRDLQTICMKAMEKEPSARYATAAELGAELERFRDGLPIHARPLSIAGRAWRSAKRNPLVASLSGVIVALLLALMVWPDPPPVEVPVKPTATRHPVRIVSTGAARVLIAPIEPTTRRPVLSNIREFPGDQASVRLEPGEYWVTAIEADGDFHEVYRTVPETLTKSFSTYPHRRWQVVNDRVLLPPITIPSHADATRGQIHVPGGEFTMGDDKSPVTPAHQREVASFYLDETEVSVARYTGQPGFERLYGYEQAGLSPHPDDAVVLVKWDQAAAWAEAAGRRLPFEDEWEFAATNRGTTPFPGGDERYNRGDWEFGSTLDDGDTTQLGILRMDSNVGEWTASPPSLYPGGRTYPPHIPLIPLNRAVRGCPPAVIDGAPDPSPRTFDNSIRGRPAYSIDVSKARIGFRCCRSEEPVCLTASE